MINIKAGFSLFKPKKNHTSNLDNIQTVYRQKKQEKSDHFFQTQTSETGLIMSVYSV